MSQEFGLPEINRAEIVGRLVREPRVDNTQSGNPRATFRVAVSRRHQGGEETAFIRCICRGETAEFARAAGRGDPVWVEGRLVQYEDNEGRRKIGIMVSRMQMLGGPGAEPLPESETHPDPGPETDSDPGPETDLDLEPETDSDPRSTLPQHLRTRKRRLFWE